MSPNTRGMRDEKDRLFEAACLIAFLTGLGLLAYSLL
jgi:hypothetical protein